MFYTSLPFVVLNMYYICAIMSVRYYIILLLLALSPILAYGQDYRNIAWVPNAYSALEFPAIGKDEVVLEYSGFVVNYNTERLIPNWVAYELTVEEVGGDVPRARGFSMDLNYPGRQAMREDYSNSGWDKGHMAPSADMKWSQTAMTESFFLTNICPQDPTLNGRDWHTLENRVRDWAKRFERVWVVCGPVVQDNKYGTIGEQAVTVPDGFFKAILRQDADGNWHTIAFVFENNATQQPLQDAVVAVDFLEALIGYDLFANLQDSIEIEIESKASWEDWR